MPPRHYSRYMHSVARTDDAQRSWLTERVPFRYRPLADTGQHSVVEGDTLFALAARQYRGLPRPAGLWWVIADFQPEPIVDPTIRLRAGQVLFIPSLRVVQEQVFNEARRQESSL